MVATSVSINVEPVPYLLLVLINDRNRRAISAVRRIRSWSVASEGVCWFLAIGFGYSLTWGATYEGGRKDSRAKRLKNEMPLDVTTHQGAFPYLFCFTTTTKGVYMREKS
jgi:hypothetical protein